jgi:ubiquinone/menaquinone biosynthesis C-methylase UbiE
MTRLPFVRRLLKVFHPEGIPWPGSVIYNRLSSTAIFQHHYDVVAQHILRFATQGDLLDVGTGPAWLLMKLCERTQAMRLVGVDVSPAMVKKAQENVAAVGLSDRIEIRESSADRLPFADDSFDAVVSTGSIHHWKEATTGLNEIHRVLKPGGHALMYDLVTNTPPSVLADMRREFGRLRTTLFWLHSFEEPFHTQESFRQLACATRFEQGQVEFVGVLCCLEMRKC